MWYETEYQWGKWRAHWRFLCFHVLAPRIPQHFPAFSRGIWMTSFTSRVTKWMAQEQKLGFGAETPTELQWDYWVSLNQSVPDFGTCSQSCGPNCSVQHLANSCFDRKPPCGRSYISCVWLKVQREKAGQHHPCSSLRLKRMRAMVSQKLYFNIFNFKASRPGPIQILL